MSWGKPTLDSQTKNCYLGINGKKYGPMSEADVLKLYSQKVITVDTKFIRAGASEWIPLRESGILAPEIDDDGLPPLPKEDKKPIKKPGTGTKIAAIALGAVVVIVAVFLIASIIDREKAPFGGKIRNSAGTQNDITGNIAGNIINGGLAAIQGDWVYYLNSFTHSDGGELIKINIDGSVRQILNDDWPSSINVVDDWIYYSHGPRSENGRIYKIRTDGSDREKLNDDSSDNIVVAGEWIFYSNLSDDGKLYRIRTDGSGRQKLNDDDSKYINVVGDRIYYSNSDDNERLYTMKTDGSGREAIWGWNFRARYINVVDDRVFFETGRYAGGGKFVYSALFVMNLDGSEMKELIEIELDSVSGIDSVNAVGNRIYFASVAGAYRGIWVMNTDGSGTRQLYDSNLVTEVNVVGNWIFYSDFGVVSWMKTDGSVDRLEDLIFPDSPSTGSSQATKPNDSPVGITAESFADTLINTNEFLCLEIRWSSDTITSFERNGYISHDWIMNSRTGGVSDVFPSFSRSGSTIEIRFPTTTRVYYLYDNFTGVFGDEYFRWNYNSDWDDFIGLGSNNIGEVLLDGVPARNFSGWTRDDVRRFFGNPSSADPSWYSYNSASFSFDRMGALTGIHTDIWKDMIRIRGVTLDTTDREGLIELFGPPLREGFEKVAGPPYVVAFMLDNSISIEFWTYGPDNGNEVVLVSVIFG